VHSASGSRRDAAVGCGVRPVALAYSSANEERLRRFFW
jgi:hypothetical protein